MTRFKLGDAVEIRHPETPDYKTNIVGTIKSFYTDGNRIGYVIDLIFPEVIDSNQPPSYALTVSKVIIMDDDDLFLIE